MVYRFVLAIVRYCVSLEGSLPALYSLGSRVTSRLDLRDNRKVITDYRNLRIIHILADLVVSSRCLAEGADKDHAPQGFVLWAGPPLRAHPMWSTVGIWGRTPHRLQWEFKLCHKRTHHSIFCVF